MAMVNMKDMLTHAFQNRYAVGAFEVVNLDFIQAIIQAAEESRSPVILNIVEHHNRSNNIELLLAAAEKSAKMANVPVAIQYDHCADAKAVKRGIRLGCNAVMFDASDASFPVNVDKTRNIVDLAHACGIPVEGALGHVCQASMESDNTLEPVLTPIQEVDPYVERTGIDFLAISIGTTHGRANGKLKLDFSRLQRINSSVNIPLVIHGGTGLSDSQYQKLIDNGVAKFNYSTALNETVLETVYGEFSNQQISVQSLFDQVRLNLVEEVKRCMQVWRSAGRAAEVLIQCRSWNHIEHLLVCETEHQDPGLLQQVLIQGQREIEEFPGVTSVQVGRIKLDDEKAQFCWLVSFACEEALDYFNKESAQIAPIKQRSAQAAIEKVDISFNMLSQLGRQSSGLVLQYA